MYESSWLCIAPAASENNGLMKTAVSRTAKPRKAATRVCSACLAFRQESDGLTLSLPGLVSSVSSAGGLSMSHRVITRAAPLNFFAGKFRRDHGDRLLVISSRVRRQPFTRLTLSKPCRARHPLSVSSSARGVSVHGRSKKKIILKAVEAPAHRLMQRSEAGVGLIDPEEPGANAALMHHAVKIILQSEKIEAVVAKVVKVIVVHPRALKLETYRAEDPASLAVDDDPPIYDVTVQAIFGGQVIGVFVEGLKKVF